MPDNLYPLALSQGMRRIFAQYGGSLPANVLKYHGKDGQYMAFTGAARPIRGGYEPMQLPDPDNAKKWVNVGAASSPAGLPTGTLEIRERRGAIPFTFGALDCPTTIYIPAGDCKTLSDFDFGWTDYLEIHGDGRALDVDSGDRAVFDADEMLGQSVNYVFDRAYAVGSLNLADAGAAAVVAPLSDATFANQLACPECGLANDGTRFRYALQAGAVASKPAVIYSPDYGATWTSVTIDTAVNAEVPTTIRVVGKYLLVSSPTAGGATTGGYYYVEINQDTGVPGSAWTKVVSGFVATFEPRDMFVLTQNEIFFVGDGGAIFKLSGLGEAVVQLSSPLATDLLRIHGRGETIVAVGASGKTIVSYNRGVNFSVTAVDADSASLTGIQVLGAKYFWVVTADGQKYYTMNGGATWIEKVMPSTAPASFSDIVFATQEVGYSLATVTDVNRLFYTNNGGVTWQRAANNSPRILNQPAFLLGSRIAVPRLSDNLLSANTILIAGTATGGTDGALYQANANII